MLREVNKINELRDYISGFFVEAIEEYEEDQSWNEYINQSFEEAFESQYDMVCDYDDYRLVGMIEEFRNTWDGDISSSLTAEEMVILHQAQYNS